MTLVAQGLNMFLLWYIKILDKRNTVNLRDRWCFDVVSCSRIGCVRCLHISIYNCPLGSSVSRERVHSQSQLGSITALVHITSMTATFIM